MKNANEKSVPLKIYEKIKQFWQTQSEFTVKELCGTFIINATPHAGVNLLEISKIKSVHAEFTASGEDKALFKGIFAEALKEESKTFSETDKDFLNSVLENHSAKECIVFGVWESKKSTAGKLFMLHSLPKSVGGPDQPEYEVIPLSYDFSNRTEKYYSITNPEIFDFRDHHGIGSLVNNLVIVKHRELFAVTKETQRMVNGTGIIVKEELIPVVKTKGPIANQNNGREEKVDFSTVNFSLLQTDPKLRRQSADFYGFDLTKVISISFQFLLRLIHPKKTA